MQTITVRFLQCVGGLLILLGVVHLAATPHIPSLLGSSGSEVYQRAVGPTLLNHVLVGVLLLPLGYTTWAAADASGRREPWAKRVLIVNAMVVASLPVAIAVYMRRPEYYTSPLFLMGVGLVGLISVLMIGATVLISRKQ